MCRFATISPSESATRPFGPTSAIGALPATAPDSRTGADAPRVFRSVMDISTCERGRNGPRIATFSNVRLGPTTSTRSWERNSPG